MSVLQELYDSEINFAVYVFWDGGFNLMLGDSVNGYRAEGWADTWADAETWFKENAIKQWPNSVFAQNSVPALTAGR